MCFDYVQFAQFQFDRGQLLLDRVQLVLDRVTQRVHIRMAQLVRYACELCVQLLLLFHEHVELVLKHLNVFQLLLWCH